MHRIPNESHRVEREIESLKLHASSINTCIPNGEDYSACVIPSLKITIINYSTTCCADSWYRLAVSANITLCRG